MVFFLSINGRQYFDWYFEIVEYQNLLQIASVLKPLPLDYYDNLVFFYRTKKTRIYIYIYISLVKVSKQAFVKFNRPRSRGVIETTSSSASFRKAGRTWSSSSAESARRGNSSSDHGHTVTPITHGT